MRYLTYCLLCVWLIGVSSAQTVYRVEREDGSVYYTDKPQPGAKKQRLDKGNSAIATAPLVSKGTRTTKHIAKARPLPSYQLTIVTPEPEQHIRDNQGRVSISAKLRPSGPGSFELWLNNQLIQTSNQPLFTLDNVDRGTQQIQIKYLHQSGKILALSPLQTFYVHRASILNRAN